MDGGKNGNIDASFGKRREAFPAVPSATFLIDKFGMAPQSTGAQVIAQASTSPQTASFGGCIRRATAIRTSLAHE